MCLLPSEESLSCAMNTTFWSQKTTYILNNPQRQKGNTKRNNAYHNLLQEKKDLRSPSCNWKESTSSSVSSLCRICFRAVSGQRTRNKSQRPSEKPALVGNHLPEAITYSKHQSFRGQSRTVETFHKWPPSVTDRNHFWGWLSSIIFLILFLTSCKLYVLISMYAPRTVLLKGYESELLMTAGNYTII